MCAELCSRKCTEERGNRRAWKTLYRHFQTSTHMHRLLCIQMYVSILVSRHKDKCGHKFENLYTIFLGSPFASLFCPISGTLHC